MKENYDVPSGSSYRVSRSEEDGSQLKLVVKSNNPDAGLRLQNILLSMLRDLEENVYEELIGQPNPDFCRPYKNMDGLYSWRGYGLESVVDFLSDVENIKSGLTNIEDLNNKRPTFRDSIAVTSVLEAANISLNNNGEWVDINI